MHFFLKGPVKIDFWALSQGHTYWTALKDFEIQEFTKSYLLNRCYIVKCSLKEHFRGSKLYP